MSLKRRLRHLILHAEKAASPVTLSGMWLAREARELAHMRRLVATPPIVVGGCGRSGTSLLVAALSCHPHVCGLETESNTFCRDEYTRDPDPSFPFMFHRMWNRLLLQPVPREATRIAEKTPKNVVHFRRILDHYGDAARVIHIVRDGRDVVLSRHPTDEGRYWVDPERWVHDVSKGLEVDDDPRVLRVRYEDLVTDFVPTMRRVCAHVDEPWHEAIEHFPHTAKVQTYLAWKDRLGPMSGASIGKWRRPEHAARARELEAYPGAMELLRRLGYEPA